MNNWIRNSMAIGNKSFVVRKLVEAVQNDEELFQCLRPMPIHEDQTTWRLKNWETASNSKDVWLCPLLLWDDQWDWLYFDFETLDEPPIALYDYLNEQGWIVFGEWYDIEKQTVSSYYHNIITKRFDSHSYSVDDPNMPDEIKEFLERVTA